MWSHYYFEASYPIILVHYNSKVHQTNEIYCANHKITNVTRYTMLLPQAMTYMANAKLAHKSSRPLSVVPLKN